MASLQPSKHNKILIALLQSISKDFFVTVKVDGVYLVYPQVEIISLGQLL